MSMKDSLLGIWQRIFASPPEVSPLTLADFPVFEPLSRNFLTPRNGVEADFFLHWIKFCKSRAIDENLTLLTLAPGFIDKIEFLIAGNTDGTNDSEIDAEFQRFKDVFTQEAEYSLNLSGITKDAIENATTPEQQIDAIRKAHEEIIKLIRANHDLLLSYTTPSKSSSSQFDKDMKSFQQDREAFHRDAANYLQILVTGTKFDSIGPTRGRSGAESGPSTTGGRPRSEIPRTTPPSDHLTDGVDRPARPEIPVVITEHPPEPGSSGNSSGHGSLADDKPIEEHPREEPHPKK